MLRIRTGDRWSTPAATAPDAAIAPTGRTGASRTGARASVRKLSRRRRGVAALWLILALPVLVLLLGVVIEIGNVWLARVELENAMEAAALAAVKEWGGAGGGSGTETARWVGVEYAKANTVTGTAVGIGTNWNSGVSPNENADCAGNLVFGAVMTNAIPWVFDAGEQAGCGYGVDLLFDASSNASLQSESSWGINFDWQTPPGTPSDLTIASVVYNLRNLDPDAYFDLTSTAPIISTGSSMYASPNAQSDTSGLDSGILTLVTAGTVYTWYNTEVEFVWDSALSARHILTVNFRNHSNPAAGYIYFQPGDRIRFGARVNDLNTGYGNNDGDGVGRERVRVTVSFAIAGVVQPSTSTGTFFNTNYGNDCPHPPKFDTPPSDIDPCIAQPGPPYFVLPVTPAEGASNDNQSVLRMSSAGGGHAPAVRAQARAVPVNSVCCRLFGTVLPVFHVSACATARYDCENQRPVLIRVRPENFICP